MNDSQSLLPLQSPPWGPHDGRCVVDLAAAIASRFGAVRPEAEGSRGTGADPLSSLADLRVARAIGEARHVVLLLFDGLGDRQLSGLIPGGAIAAARSSSLSSVFPSSTAPAITSLATASFPAAHGNPGWFCWSDELGAVVRTLPMDLRGVSDSPIEAGALWDWQSASVGFDVPVVAIQPDFIAESTFSRHAWSAARRIGYRSVDDLLEAVEGAVRGAPDGAYVWAYLPQFDSVSHEKGWQSEAASAVARRFDGVFARLAERLRDTDALLLATADHGFIDVPAAQQLRLADFPEVGARLVRPLTGEPRVVYCYARDGEHQAFERAARAALGFAFEVVPSRMLVEAGWFGPGAVSPRLAARIGSHTLIGRDRFTLVDQMPGEAPASFVGMHGGIHPDELGVPLAAVRRGGAV